MKKILLLFLMPFFLNQSSKGAQKKQPFIVQMTRDTIELSDKQSSIKRVAFHMQFFKDIRPFVVYKTIDTETLKEFPANPVSFYNDLKSALPFSTRKTALQTLDLLTNKPNHGK